MKMGKRKKQLPKLDAIDQSIVDFWQQYVDSNGTERLKMFDTILFENESDKRLAISYFNDLFFVLPYLKVLSKK
jgi:hypothetical protein